MSDNYVYPSLEPNEIRVLRLNSGSWDDPLSGKLEHLTLDDSTQIQRDEAFEKEDIRHFTAISYAWGERKANRKLHIDGRYLPITESLFTALRCRRENGDAVYFWADQICINQNDLDERAQQVALMYNIFSRAYQVIVWLGEASATDHLAFHLMRLVPGIQVAEFATLYREWDVKGMVVQSSDCAIDFETLLKQPRQEGHLDASVRWHHCLAAFRLFTRKPWFDRLWVVQEVVCARQASFVCGSHSISSSDLFKAFETYTKLVHRGVLPAFQDAREQQIKDLYDTSPSQFGTWQDCENAYESLFELLMRTATLQVSDPHDRVFALVSLAFKGLAPTVKVDYRIALQELWCQVARQLLQGLSSFEQIANPVITSTSQYRFTTPRQSLGFLLLALRGTQTSYTFEEGSGWAPDFNCLSKDSQRKYAWYVQESAYNAAGGYHEAPLSPCQNPDVLSMVGVICDGVKDVYDPTSRSSHLHPFYKTRSAGSLQPAEELVDWYLACVDFLQEHQYGREVYDFSFFLRQGMRITHLDEAELRDRSGTIEEAFAAALRRRAKAGDQNLPSTSDTFDHLSMLFLSEGARNLDWSRSLAVTVHGRLSWVSRQTRPGDEVCLIQGAPFPFIVRQRTEEYFGIVGDAYVHGIMGGEAWPRKGEEVGILSFQ